MTREELITNFILNTPITDILGILEEIHPVDFLEALSLYDGNPMDLLEKLPYEYIALMVDEAEIDEKYNLLTLFSKSSQKKILNEMASDELADMLGIMDEDDQEDILNEINEEFREEMAELLTYDPETAGGLMATEFISLREDMTIDEALKHLREISPTEETPYYIYVLDQSDILKGIVPIRALITTEPQVPLQDVMLENVNTIPIHMQQEDVSNIFEKYGYLAMPVVDAQNVMQGVITADDIMEVLSEEHTKDLYRLAGIDDDEVVGSTIATSIKSRLPWLLVNLVTAMLASAMVSLFDGTIAQVVALAIFMPLVTGMGGNAGTQTLTLIIRGIALGDIDFENSKDILKKEFTVGIIHGLILGIIVAVIGGLFQKTLVFGLVIGFAMFLNMTIASLAGFFVPLFLKKINVDPALASAVFVTTVTDVLGFFFFLGLATLFITYLV
ncbi:MAG: magnesium transporter [Clostridium sp.]|nr:magnesium transporter [Clostridium sp.]